MFNIFLLPLYLLRYMARHPRVGLAICMAFVVLVIIYPESPR